VNCSKPLRNARGVLGERRCGELHWKAYERAKYPYATPGPTSASRLPCPLDLHCLGTTSDVSTSGLIWENDDGQHHIWCSGSGVRRLDVRRVRQLQNPLSQALHHTARCRSAGPHIEEIQSTSGLSRFDQMWMETDVYRAQAGHRIESRSKKTTEKSKPVSRTLERHERYVFLICKLDPGSRHQR
jgi:hypothetical protein